MKRRRPMRARGRRGSPERSCVSSWSASLLWKRKRPRVRMGYAKVDRQTCCVGRLLRFNVDRDRKGRLSPLFEPILPVRVLCRDQHPRYCRLVRFRDHTSHAAIRVLADLYDGRGVGDDVLHEVRALAASGEDVQRVVVGGEPDLDRVRLPRSSSDGRDVTELFAVQLLIVHHRSRATSSSTHTSGRHANRNVAYIDVPRPALTCSHESPSRCTPRAIERGRSLLVTSAPKPGRHTCPPCVWQHTIK